MRLAPTVWIAVAANRGRSIRTVASRRFIASPTAVFVVRAGSSGILCERLKGCAAVGVLDPLPHFRRCDLPVRLESLY